MNHIISREYASWSILTTRFSMLKVFCMGQSWICDPVMSRVLTTKRLYHTTVLRDAKRIYLLSFVVKPRSVTQRKMGMAIHDKNRQLATDLIESLRKDTCILCGSSLMQRHYILGLDRKTKRQLQHEKQDSKHHHQDPHETYHRSVRWTSISNTFAKILIKIIFIQQVKQR